SGGWGWRRASGGLVASWVCFLRQRLLQRQRDRAQPCRAHAPVATWCLRQQGGKRHANHHHRPHIGVKAPCPGDVAVIDAPENLHPGIDAFHRGPPLVPSLELLRGPRNGREPPQIERTGYADDQSVSLARVTALVIGTG